MEYYPNNMDSDAVKLYPDTQVQFKKFNNSATPNAPLPEPAVVPLHQPLLGPDNTVTTCQFCRASVKTAVKYTTTSRTHMAAAICGLMCCCCCIPYFSESAKNSDHYCPNCHRFLGTYVK